MLLFNTHLSSVLSLTITESDPVTAKQNVGVVPGLMMENNVVVAGAFDTYGCECVRILSFQMMFFFPADTVMLISQSSLSYAPLRPSLTFILS